MPDDAIKEAYRKVKSITSPSLVESNRDFHKQVIEGYDVTFRKGELLKTEKAKLIDFNNPNNNDADAHCIECNSESSDDSFMIEEQDFFQCEMELEPEYYEDSFSYVRIPMGSKLSPREALKIDKREKVSSKNNKSKSAWSHQDKNATSYSKRRTRSPVFTASASSSTTKRLRRKFYERTRSTMCG